MRLFFTVVVVLLAICCADGVSKRDLSEGDVEMIIKALMSKMEHGGAVDSELIHKKVGVDKEHYFYEPEKVHLSDMKEDEMKYLAKSHPVEHEYMKESVPLERGYEMKKDVGAVEKDMMALLMKIKELSTAKSLEDSYKKEMYETPEEKYISEKVHLSKDPAMLEKMLEEKFSDKDVSLAESLYHMKIAGDIETYPNIKLEHLMHDKNLGEEKLGADEAYLKKVDEIGKSLLKEETYAHHKGEDIEGHLKKATEEEKYLFYEPKVAHSEAALKSAEEKAIETWKAEHKDLFAAEGGILLDEKIKKEGVHHVEEGIAHGISDELMKKLKESIGLDKELGKENEELLLHLSKELHKEAGMEKSTFAYEKAKEQAEKDAHIHLSEEEMKKYIDEAMAFGAKEKMHGSEFLFEKGLGEEKTHGINTKTGAGMEKSLHELLEEEASKAKEAHALDESYGFAMDKAKFGGKLPLEGEIKHSIASEAEKAFKAHEDELKKAFEADSLHHKAQEEEILKKEKAYGTDTFLHKSLEEELLKKEKAHQAAEASLHKAREEDFLKKEKAYGTDAFLHKAQDELLKKEKAYGTDGFLHKTHEDELIKKEIAYGTDAHKFHDEEAMKKELAYGTGPFLHKAHEDGLIKKETAFGTDAHKFHDEEQIKKEIAYGSDSLFHKNKEVIGAADHHLHHEMKGEEDGILHGIAHDKHHVEGGIAGAEKSHKTLHDIKTKFFELLKRVLHFRKCHLVTMRPGELLGIVNCISRSKDPVLCEKFAMCEKKKPRRVIAALEKCQKETIPGEAKKCTSYAPLYPTTEIPLKIFQCVAITTGELLPEEKKFMIEFEECARVVKAESCGRFKFFPRPY